jgi:hypothetical protein
MIWKFAHSYLFRPTLDLYTNLWKKYFQSCHVTKSHLNFFKFLKISLYLQQRTFMKLCYKYFHKCILFCSLDTSAIWCDVSFLTDDLAHLEDWSDDEALGTEGNTDGASLTLTAKQKKESRGKITWSVWF